MNLIPHTKVQAASFAVAIGALGAFIVVVLQAYGALHCPLPGP